FSALWGGSLSSVNAKESDQRKRSPDCAAREKTRACASRAEGDASTRHPAAAMLDPTSCRIASLPRCDARRSQRGETAKAQQRQKRLCFAFDVGCPSAVP